MVELDAGVMPENGEVALEVPDIPEAPAMLTRDPSDEYRGRLREAMEQWREKHDQWRRDRYEKKAEILNAVKRDFYKREKAAKGEDVRPYVHRHIQQGQSEAAFEYLRRRDRECKRMAYHAKAEAEGRQVRGYNDLSAMSEVELKAYKREQNSSNKRLSRARKKAAQFLNSLADTSQGV